MNAVSCPPARRIKRPEQGLFRFACRFVGRIRAGPHILIINRRFWTPMHCAVEETRWRDFGRRHVEMGSEREKSVKPIADCNTIGTRRFNHREAPCRWTAPFVGRWKEVVIAKLAFTHG